MENHLEHKIANAYESKDKNISFGNKEKLWGQIAKELGHSGGVASGWRIAALFFALFAFGSIFGSSFMLKKHSKQNNDLQVQNSELQLKVDSLLTLNPEIITETITIEKEKIVYRELKTRPVSRKKETSSPDYSVEIQQLKTQLTHSENNYQLLKDSLITLQKILAENANPGVDKQKEIIPDFKLKTEQVKEQMQEVKTSDVPRMKLQILKIRDNVKYETGTTLFKK